ncbi:MAG: CopD family protein, partial [Pseudomonadota bacterium]
MAIAITLHILATILWIGGMFFAYVALRPAAASLLEPPQRLPLWAATFARFFPWVWVSVVVLPATGYWMVFYVFDGLRQVGLHVHLMQGLGWLMIVIYLFVFFAPYRQLKAAVAAKDWPAGGKALARIRRLVGINLLLGIALTIIATGGAYLGGLIAALGE